MIVTKRTFPRIHYEAPIRFAELSSDQYDESRILNFSRGGLYFESGRILKPDSDIGVIMVNYTPGTYGPEAYRFYVSKVKWCKKVYQNGKSIFGVGAQFISKSHEIDKEVISQMYTCDLCGQIVRSAEIQHTCQSASLCPHCYKHWESLQDGVVKKSIERFLAGNIY